MWSSRPGGLCRSASAPRDPLCDSQNLCQCPHSTPNNFCCAFSVSIVCGHFWSEQKHTPLFDFLLQMLYGNWDRPVSWMHPDIHFTDILFCALWEIFYPSYIYFSKTIANQTKLPLAVYTIILAWGNKNIWNKITSLDMSDSWLDYSCPQFHFKVINSNCSRKLPKDLFNTQCLCDAVGVILTSGGAVIVWYCRVGSWNHRWEGRADFGWESVLVGCSCPLFHTRTQRATRRVH